MVGIVKMSVVVVFACVFLAIGAQGKTLPKHHIIHHQNGCMGGRNPFCCQSKDNTCRVYGPRLNNNQSKTCFCDSECMKLGDCCTDYQHACRAVDCLLASEWSDYGECSVKCGGGFKERTKMVLQEASNGGAPCGARLERISCHGDKCKVARAHDGGLEEIRETGKIIPAMYGSWRKNRRYDPYSDIRKNLFYHYNKNSIIRRPPYCATYELTHAKKSCQSTFFGTWAPMLRSGASICVECQQFAMARNLGVRCRGHGVYLRETRWNAVTIPGCHGKWIMKTKQRECSCDPKGHDMSFILL